MASTSLWTRSWLKGGKPRSSAIRLPSLANKAVDVRRALAESAALACEWPIRLSWLDAFERAARFSWQLDLNPVTDSYFAARTHDAHDSCFSNHVAPAVSG